MNWLEQKYVTLLSGQLQQFQRKGPELYNFRCPLCGDSKKDRFKSRGYIYSNKGKTYFHCHNCSTSQSFDNFLKDVNEGLFFDYLLEKKVENRSLQTFQPEVKKEIIIPQEDIFLGLRTIAKLNDDHFAKQYVVSRQIPTNFHYQLYFSTDYNKWVNGLVPDKLDERFVEPRLVIPFRDYAGNCYGFQGRDFKKEKTPTRYMTIILDANKPNFYGLDRVKRDERIYCLEGPIDAMFIPNALASFGGFIHKNVESAGFDKDNVTIVYDNEKRNKEIVRNMNRAIQNGFHVCIWPEKNELKDINDMVLARIKNRGLVDNKLIQKIVLDIKQTIDENTYSGFEGQRRLQEWQRA